MVILPQEAIVPVLAIINEVYVMPKSKEMAHRISLD